MTLSLENCRVFDGSNEDLLEDASVVVDGGRIVAVHTGRTESASCERINCRGRVLMPGLIDAHVHAYAPTFSFYNNDRLPHTLLALHAARTLEGMLARGFTTVRDAGGADRGLWLAIEHKLIKGPRLFFSGKALSQTGGHGDMRPADQHEPCACGSYSGSISRVVDGADAVRAAAREELRQGAHQIKLFVTGGISSPTDPIWMNQFTDTEIQAAVEEARTRRRYVMAHCHTDAAVQRCIRLGIRTIEHGTHIEADTASALAASNMYVVPTLSVVDIVTRQGAKLGMPPESVKKVAGVYEQMAASIQRCAKAGVQLGLGTDILSHELQALQGGELALRGQLQRPVEVLRSATSINAALLQHCGELGCIKPGAIADILLVDGEPLKDVSLFRDPFKNIPFVMKQGEIVRNALPP